ncbi:MAG: rhomboid family intramembrane serine protease [Actinomycetota bacterium]|nr:rhomboid family intramembrane serine protease [Actinomycetota bacterium]
MLALIPISDANPTRNFPVVTIALIAINVLVFFFVEPGFGTSPEATQYFYENAPVPCQLADECPADFFPPEIAEPTLSEFVWALLFSTFLHGGFLHLGGNMLFLWVFGNNIEDYLGRVKYVAFYLLGGLAAGLAHVLWTLRLEALPSDAVQACLGGAAQGCGGIGQYVPAVGASGAVAAVMGAYLILFPRHKVNVLVPIVIIWTVIQMSAFVVLGLWFVYQFLIGGPDIAGVGEHSGVAWMAHVGGFVFGALGILLLGGRPQRPHHLLRPGWRY